MADPNTTPPDSSSSDPSVLSDLGALGKGALQFIGSPAGGQIISGGLGMYESGQASKQLGQLYSPIQGTGGTFSQAGTQTLKGVQPALTASIPGQTGFATQQQGVALQYGTGQLTADQNAQIESYRQGQKSRAMAELASAGINDPNSSQMQTKMQEIDNNAAAMAQNLVAGNQQIAQGAESAVQGVYNTILQQALQTAGLGTEAQLAAARGIIQGDTQIGGSLQTLLKGISALATTGQPTAGQPGGVAAGQQGGGTNVAQTAWGAGKDLLSKMGINVGGGGTQAPTTPATTDSGWGGGYIWGGGPGGSDYAPGVSVGAPTTTAATDTGGIGTPNWLSGMSSSFDPSALSFDSAPTGDPSITTG